MTEKNGQAEDTTPKRAAPRTSLKALLPLAPYALRHRGEGGRSLLALTVASAAATLTVPIAVRGMIDNGFSAENVGAIDRYFGAMMLVVGVLALASGFRYYLVMTIGERVVADLRRDGLRSSRQSRRAFLRQVAHRRTRVAPDRRHDADEVGLRRFRVRAVAQPVHVLRRHRDDDLHQPEIVGPRADRDSHHRHSACAIGRSVRERSKRAQDTLAEASAFAAENLGAVRTMQAFNAQPATVGRFGGAVEDAYEAARSATGARSVLTVVAIFSPSQA